MKKARHPANMAGVIITERMFFFLKKKGVGTTIQCAGEGDQRILQLG